MLIVYVMRCVCVCVYVGCTGNGFEQVGAQYIGDGLKSLTSLTTLNLSGEC